MSIVLLIGIGLFILCAIAGAPIFAVIGGITLLLFHFIGQDLAVIMGDVYKITTAPALVAIPLFIFAGYYLSESNIARRMLDFFEAVVGWLKGGICLAAIVATDIFTAFTGASAVTIVAFGGMLVPLLKEKGYSDRFSYGLMTISGSSGLLFPPCIAVILYGIIAKTSIQGLYIAAIIPAFLLIGGQFAYSSYRSFREAIPTTSFTPKKLILAINGVKWEIPLILFIMGGIFGGIITVEEAAAVTVLYVLIVEGLILKEVKWNKLPHIIRESMIMLGAIFFILGIALSFTNYLAYQEVPQKILEAMKVFITNKWTFLLVLNLFLLVVGMMIDIFSAIIIVVPLILPLTQYYGINPIHLGVIFLINLELGYSTPPVGINLFISSLRFRKPVLDILRGIIPFFIIMLGILLAVTFYSPFSLWLVKLFKIVQDVVFM